MFPVRIFHRIVDLLITILLWIYFTLGYLLILPLLYIPAYIIAGNSSTALQNLNHIHLKCFFALIRFLVPSTKLNIADDVLQIRASVVICNHLSYLDPILLVSLFQRQKTIVKYTFFKVPIFGWFLKNYGYISSGSDNMSSSDMINQLEDIKEHLASGGVLFVFPEGTRSRVGKLMPFNRGVFTIARYCKAPLKLVLIRGTNKLFPPGHFLFDTHGAHEIRLELIGSLEPDYSSSNFSIAAVADEARKMFEEKLPMIDAKPGHQPLATDKI